MSERVVRWKQAWESRDPDAVAALYRPDARHRSPKVARTMPEASGGTLEGVDQIREYARRAFMPDGRFWFEIASVVETAERSMVEYVRRAEGDDGRGRRVAEVLEWRDGLLAEVRVYHG